ncbi:MAG: glycosyltransferase family 4 protein [Chlorobiales bacterium]|nr:glycosyltransferase family 4 protein [Chlorobiales bacterium]
MSHIILIGGVAHSLVNFRGDFIRACVEAGHRVTAMSEPASKEQIAAIEALGADYKPYPIQKSGLNPVEDLYTLQHLIRVFGKIVPDVVLAYTIKPIIWSGIALRVLSSKTSFFALITGLGYAFQGSGLAGKALAGGVSSLYRVSLSSADGVIFQNKASKRLFINRRIVEERHCHLVGGSGVNLDRFNAEPLPRTVRPVFLLIARLIREKGIHEYVQAARIVKKKYPQTDFLLLGRFYDAPGGIAREEVDSWQKEGVIRFLGSTEDVRPFLASSHVFVLPSKYGEGLSRSIMEALATGRPVLTTDNPGCREMVVDGKNGFIVPTADAESLAEKMIWMLENRHRWKDMGCYSRKLAERGYDVHRINRELKAIMGL